MEAVSPGAVATQLQEDGMTPVDIGEVQAVQGKALNLDKVFSARVSPVDLIQFSRQMASLSRAGVPILNALHGLSQSTHNTKLSQAILDIARRLEGGRDLASAMSQHPDIFSQFYVAMIRIGETTGQLEEIFVQLVRYLERDRQTRTQIKSALRYPSFVVAAVIGAIAIINLFVIPSFARVFARFGSDLPIETRLLLGASDFTVHHWPTLLGIVIVGGLGLRHALRTEQGRYRWDRYKLKLPLAGTIIQRAVLARFARMFAMSIHAGVPLIQTLTVVAKATDNRYLEDRILGMRTGLERGESVSNAASRTGIFDALVMQMITVGEETGSIDTLLSEVAKFYEEEVDQDIKRLSARIEPLLTVTVAGVVLVLALGVFLPMWNLAEVAIKK